MWINWWKAVEGRPCRWRTAGPSPRNGRRVPCCVWCRTVGSWRPCQSRAGQPARPPRRPSRTAPNNVKHDVEIVTQSTRFNDEKTSYLWSLAGSFWFVPGTIVGSIDCNRECRLLTDSSYYLQTRRGKRIYNLTDFMSTVVVDGFTATRLCPQSCTHERVFDLIKLNLTRKLLYARIKIWMSSSPTVIAALLSL